MEKTNICENNFWEFCLFAGENFKCYFDKIKRQFKSNREEVGVFAYDEVNNAFLFGTDIAAKEFLESKIKNEICLFIQENIKSKYLLSNLENTAILGNLKPILLKVLCLFDSEIDRLEIEKNLRLNDRLYLNEFFAFKSKSLQQKWKKICEITNENNYFFSSSELTFQLLRFLIKNCKKNIAPVYIKFEDKINIYKENTLIKSFDKNFQTKDGGNQIILTILDNLPNNVVLFRNENFNEEFVALLKLIFNNSLKIIDYA